MSDEARNIAERIGDIIYRLLEGDDMTDTAFITLRDLNLVDENYEWIYPEDE